MNQKGGLERNATFVLTRGIIADLAREAHRHGLTRSELARAVLKRGLREWTAREPLFPLVADENPEPERDPPILCAVCGRKFWGYGKELRPPHHLDPDRVPCDGRFRDAATAPSSGPERLDALIEKRAARRVARRARRA